MEAVLIKLEWYDISTIPLAQKALSLWTNLKPVDRNPT